MVLSSDPSSEQSASDASTETEQSSADVIHDVCSKTASHADCVRREGDVQAAVDALVPGFKALCQRDGALPVASLQILVRQLVKVRAYLAAEEASLVRLRVVARACIFRSLAG